MASADTVCEPTTLEEAQAALSKSMFRKTELEDLLIPVNARVVSLKKLIHKMQQAKDMAAWRATMKKEVESLGKKPKVEKTEQQE